MLIPAYEAPNSLNGTETLHSRLSTHSTSVGSDDEGSLDSNDFINLTQEQLQNMISRSPPPGPKLAQQPSSNVPHFTNFDRLQQNSCQESQNNSSPVPSVARPHLSLPMTLLASDIGDKSLLKPFPPAWLLTPKRWQTWGPGFVCSAAPPPPPPNPPRLREWGVTPGPFLHVHHLRGRLWRLTCTEMYATDYSVMKAKRILEDDSSSHTDFPRIHLVFISSQHAATSLFCRQRSW